MKKIIVFFFLVVFLLGSKVFAEMTGLLSPDEIYVFTLETCPHCIEAKKYIRTKYPELNVHWLEISKPENWRFFIACAAKFRLDQSNIGTPLFCMGNNYIMGWGRFERKQFEEYVEEFLPEE